MFFSVKRRSSATASEWKDCKKTLHYLETWALRAVLTPSRSLLLLLLLWPPLPPHRDLRLLGQDHSHPYLPPLLILRCMVATGSPSTLYFCPLPSALALPPPHTPKHTLFTLTGSTVGGNFFNLKLVCLARASNLFGMKPIPL